jgi:hypothetical protein
VAQVKGKHGKGKGKGNKGRNKASFKSENVKKSRLNLEYPKQSDNYNGVDIDSSKKNPTRWDWKGPSSLILGSLIDNKLKIDGETGVDQSGFVNEGILRPKIFSSFYNTPDSFRLGVEVTFL